MPVLPTTSIHDRCMGDLAAILAALNLQGAVDGQGHTIVGNIGSRVFEQMLPDESNITLPCLLATTADEPVEDDEEGSNFEADGVIYPVRILICDRVSARWQDARPTYQLWDFIITQTLEGLETGPFPFLPNTPECWKIRVRRLNVFDFKAPQYQFLVSGMVARCHTLTPRWRGGQVPS